MLLLKTHKEHMDGVRRNKKHATDGEPQKVAVGDLLLIQATSGRPGNEIHRVWYAMRFRRCYEDRDDESVRIWGHRYRYIIEGDDFRNLRRRFDIDKVKVTDTNCGKGVIRFAYVDPADEQAIIAGGYLESA